MQCAEKLCRMTSFCFFIWFLEYVSGFNQLRARPIFPEASTFRSFNIHNLKAEITRVWRKYSLYIVFSLLHWLFSWRTVKGFARFSYTHYNHHFYKKCDVPNFVRLSQALHFSPKNVLFDITTIFLAQDQLNETFCILPMFL